MTELRWKSEDWVPIKNGDKVHVWKVVKGSIPRRPHKSTDESQLFSWQKQPVSTQRSRNAVEPEFTHVNHAAPQIEAEPA